MVFSTDLTYGKKLFVKESFAEFIFGIHQPKTLQYNFLRHLCTFCMIFLKTVRFCKSEIAFIFIFVEKNFAEKVVKLEKNLFNNIEEGYLFCKKLDDLQEKTTIIDTNCKNAFRNTTYLGY